MIFINDFLFNLFITCKWILFIGLYIAIIVGIVVGLEWVLRKIGMEEESRGFFCVMACIAIIVLTIWTLINGRF